ncbi:unnamed protein product [Amoebophrya sp. A25]|nr:unnamed protein product [Amoebophrya sp. A25]|eukprot:GSA25T00012364001.1
MKCFAVTSGMISTEESLDEYVRSVSGKLRDPLPHGFAQLESEESFANPPTPEDVKLLRTTVAKCESFFQAGQNVLGQQGADCSDESKNMIKNILPPDTRDEDLTTELLVSNMLGTPGLYGAAFNFYGTVGVEGTHHGSATTETQQGDAPTPKYAVKHMAFLDDGKGSIDSAIKKRTDEFCMNLVVTALQANPAWKESSADPSTDSPPYKYIPALHEIHLYEGVYRGRTQIHALLVMDQMADGTLAEYLGRTQPDRRFKPGALLQKLYFLRALLRSYDQLLQDYFFIHEIAQISHNNINPANIATPMKKLAILGPRMDLAARSLIFDFGHSKWSWKNEEQVDGVHNYRSDEWSMSVMFLEPVAGPIVYAIQSRASDVTINRPSQCSDLAKGKVDVFSGALPFGSDGPADPDSSGHVDRVGVLSKWLLRDETGTGVNPEPFHWAVRALFFLTRKWGLQCEDSPPPTWTPVKRGQTVRWRRDLRRLRLLFEVAFSDMKVGDTKFAEQFMTKWQSGIILGESGAPDDSKVYESLDQLLSSFGETQIRLYRPDDDLFQKDSKTWTQKWRTVDWDKIGSRSKQGSSFISFVEPASVSGFFPPGKWLEEATARHLTASSERMNSTLTSSRAYFAARMADIYNAETELLAVWYYNEVLTDLRHVGNIEPNLGDRRASREHGFGNKSATVRNTPSSTGGLKNTYNYSTASGVRDRLQDTDTPVAEDTLVSINAEQEGAVFSLDDALATRLGKFITEAPSDGVALVHFRLSLDSLERISPTPTSLHTWTPTGGGVTAFGDLLENDYAGHNDTGASGVLLSGIPDVYRLNAQGSYGVDGFSLISGRVFGSLAWRGFQILQGFDTISSRCSLYSALIASASDWHAAAAFYREYESLYNRGGRLDDTRLLLHSLAGWQYLLGQTSHAGTDALEGGSFHRLFTMLLVEAPDWELALTFYHQFHRHARLLLLEPLTGTGTEENAPPGLASINSTLLASAVVRLSHSAAKLRDTLQVRLDFPQGRVMSGLPLSSALKARVGIFSALMAGALTDVAAILYYMEGRLELASSANSTSGSGMRMLPGSMLLSARALLLDSLADALSARVWPTVYDKSDLRKAERFAATVIRMAPDEHAAAAYHRKYLKRAPDLSHRAYEILGTAVANHQAERRRNQIEQPDTPAEELPVLLLSRYLLSEEGRIEEASADNDEDDDLE